MYGRRRLRFAALMDTHWMAASDAGGRRRLDELGRRRRRLAAAEEEDAEADERDAGDDAEHDGDDGAGRDVGAVGLRLHGRAAVARVAGVLREDGRTSEGELQDVLPPRPPPDMTRNW